MTTIPYRSDADINSAALELLAKIGKGTVGLRPPIPVDAIIEKHLRISLEIVDMQRRVGLPDVLGAAYPRRSPKSSHRRSPQK